MSSLVCEYVYLSGTVLYSYELDAVLSPWAHLKSLGLPEHVDFSDVKETAQKSFAGEGCSLPVLAMILFAFYANPHAPWWPEYVESESD